MPEELKFYPEQKTVTINPLDKKGELRYFLEGFPGKITQKEITLKYAFPAKLGTASQDLKDKVRNILVNILDISKFSVGSVKGKATVVVPICQLADTSLLAQEGTIKVPILVKLVKQEGETPLELKCAQEILLITDMPKETPEPKDLKDKPVEKVVEKAEEPEAEEETASVDFGDKLPEEAPKKSLSFFGKGTKKEAAKEVAKEETEDEEEGEATEKTDEEAKEEEKADTSGLYSGLMAIDYGTTNSAIVVRDPRYAAEEVRGQLSTQQWGALCDWINSWLISHLSKVDPNETDLFVENLTQIVPNAALPKCGTPEDEIRRSLLKMDDAARQQILSETLCRLSNFSQEGTSSSKILKDIAPEVMYGFESVIDSKTLESQRYFVLELDENAGPCPIPSTLQVLSAPNTEDLAVLMQETKVDMGARVSLLLRSAASGGADIRQFVISIKRYFGRDEVIEVVPAENSGTPIQFPADTLCRLAYRELLNRAIGDIHRRADAGQFQDAEWPCSIVATFPTSYPASLRRNLKEILTELNIKEIDTRFDEATAAAIYYVWREVGADPVCAMNGLMARCRKDRHGRSYQNILLYDLGGGTTDIALIQLLYEELPIFSEDADRGNGGRYFRITPRLLGTTGHRYIGGDLITLWLFRLIKTRFADGLLKLITEKNIEPPIDSPLSQVLMNLPETLVENKEDSEAPPRYRAGALMEWTNHPMQQMRQYNHLNETLIDLLVPTRFANDASKTSNFFTLWEMVEEVKKTLGTPVDSDKSSGVATEWPEETELDSGLLFNFVQNAHPWLTESGIIQQDDLRMSIGQQELTRISRDPIKQSLSLAVSLSKARLLTQDHRDRIDRLILSGLSCNMQCVQVVANEVFRESDGVFDYDPANVRFDRDSAKTSVALGACIGRYLESVRIDPFNEKTKQMLRDGYDQVELVIENLFTYLSCRLAYDSLVAMVTIFDQGHELNLRSYTDRRPVARTSIHNLRPVQEKFWIYRIDFEGAEPQYLGLINAEAVAIQNEFQDFRKFREEYLVGFEADAELFVRAFFLPRGPKTVYAKSYQEPSEGGVFPELISRTGAPSKQTQNEGKEKTTEKAPGKPAPKAPEKKVEPKKGLKPEVVEDLEESAAIDLPEEDMPEQVEGELPEDVVNTEDTVEDELAEDNVDKEENEEEGDDAESAPNEVVPDEQERLAQQRAKDKELPEMVVTNTITSQEIFDRRPVIQAGTPLEYTIEYPDGSRYKCAISEPLPIRESYEFHIEAPSTEAPFDPTAEPDPSKITKFEISEEDTDEATLICDERGNLVMLTSSPYDIQIWADIEYIPQKMDIHYDPFCGHH